MESDGLMLQLHNGDITLREYLDTKASTMGLGSVSSVNMNGTASDRQTGITPRMKAYCVLHGLGGDGFLNVVWKVNRRYVYLMHPKLLMRTRPRIHDR